MAGRIKQHPPPIGRWLVNSTCCAQPRSLCFGLIEVGYGEIEVHLLGSLILRPGWRAKTIHLDGCKPYLVGFDRSECVAGEDNLPTEQGCPERS